jgi:hypothetical protein
MADDFIRYDILIQEAMRGLVRTVLKDAGVRGLPGDHHFFISFDTNHPGVTLSTRMRAQYPQEMTVVLQHQFWDLKVTDDNFEVGLSFNGITERLVIPFAAIRRFADPSVNFDIRFAEITEGAQAASSDESVEKKDAPAKLADTKEQKSVDEKSNAPKSDLPKGEMKGEVVSLDRFRKK